jgi:CRISPR/Cas system-associated exonuclease Cas4 (RecB family)
MNRHTFIAGVIAALAVSFASAEPKTIINQKSAGYVIQTRHTSALWIDSGISMKEAFRIEQTGRIFWRGREVETDDDLRSAVLELRDAMFDARGCASFRTLERAAAP